MGSPIDEQRRRLDIRVHLGEADPRGLEVRQGTAELTPGLGVGKGLREGSSGDPQRLRADADPPVVEGAHRDVEPFPFSAKLMAQGNPDLIEHQLRQVGGAKPHLVFFPADRKPLAPTLDEKGGDPPVSFGWIGVAPREDEVDPRLSGVRDPHLRSVQQPAIGRLVGAEAQRSRIAPAPRLRQAEGAHVPAREPREEVLLLLLRAEEQDGKGADGVVDGDRDGDRRAGPRQLFDDTGVEDRPDPRSPVLLGDQ